MRTALLLLLALSTVGCPKDEKSSPKEEKSDKAEKKKDKGDDEKPKKKGDDEEKKGDDEDKPKKKKKADVAAPERTKTPTVAEWNAAKDLTVDDNDVGCEVRAVREWARVSCRKKSPGGGEPSGIAVFSGKSKETFVFSKPGVQSIVTPLLPGTRTIAKISWTDVVYAVRIEWAKDEERPEVWAHFAKTDDEPTKLPGLAMCECYKGAPWKGKCVEGDDGWSITNQNPACEKTFKGDCEKMVACGRGEPGAMPKCDKGDVLIYPGNVCAKECKAASDCSKGQTCEEIPMGGKKACTE
ncbi:MAG: hypothetical protein ACXVEF_04510 [Polyangiales bacterium]